MTIEMIGIDVDLRECVKAAAWGGVVGLAGGAATSIGSHFLIMPSQIGKPIGSSAAAFKDFGTVGGVLGNVGGTVLTEQ